MVILINIADTDTDICFSKNIINRLIHLKTKLKGIGTIILYDNSTNTAELTNSYKPSEKGKFDVYLDNTSSWLEIEKYLST